MPGTYPISLTALESQYLSDSISMFASGPPDDMLSGKASPYPDLLLKIGGAVVEIEEQGDKKSPVPVDFSQAELWIIREVAKSGVVVGNERVGLNLLVKAYEGIRALAAEPDIQALVERMGEVTESEPGKDSYVSQLEKIKNEQDSDGGGVAA